MFPILIDLSKHRCLIVGGGAVATRKANALLDGGATQVTAVASQFAEQFPGAVTRIVSDYRAEYLEGITLIFAATDRPDVNDAVLRDAAELRIWANRVDSSEALPGDFSTAAMWRAGAAVVAVSAGSAALSKRIKDQLQSNWDPRWTAMADAMQILRPEIKDRFNEPTRRRLFKLLAEDRAMDILQADGIDGLRQFIESIETC